jgi:hypothetical protein
MRYAAVVLCVMAVACAKAGRTPASARDTLTVRQRDSVLGASRIPGARGIQRAMTAADSTSARAAQADSIQ